MDQSNEKLKLNSYLNKYSTSSFYLNFKFKIYNYLNSIINEKELYDKLKDINEKILEPKKLLSTEQNDRVPFFDSASEDHELFLPYKYWVGIFEAFKNELDQERHAYLVELFQELIQGYKEFIKYLVLEAKANEKSPKRMNMYNNDVYLVDEHQLEFKEINLDRAYEISCYNENEYDYVGTNSSGNSIGKQLGNCYIKVDNGNGLLAPANECAVYKFYGNLYGSDQQLIVPTQLIILSKIPILPANLRDSPQRKKMKEIKEREKFTLNKQVFIFDPQLKLEVKGAMKIERTLSIQSSLFRNGPTLEVFLKDIFNHQNQNQPLHYESTLLSSIDLYSFSCHILSSLLLLPEDYKADNLIIDSETKQIVGIDNDRCLENDEMKKERRSNTLLIKIKNILYLLEPLMNKSISEKARDQFISKQCHHLVLDWLMYMYENEQKYDKMIEMSLFTNYLELPKRQVFEQTQQSLHLPIKFQSGFITSMICRFKIIQELLKENQKLTHQQLFNQIHPFASAYYHATKQVYPGNPLDQISSMYHQHGYDERVQNHLFENSKSIYKDYFKNLSNHEFIQSESSISLKNSIVEFINNLNVLDLISDKNEPSFLEIIKLIIKLSREYKFKLQLNDSWRMFIQKTLKMLMNQDASQDTIKEFINILNLKSNQYLDQDVLGEESSIINITLALQISAGSKIKYIKLFTSFGLGVNMVSTLSTLGLSVSEKIELSSLDLAVSYCKNKNDSIGLFKLLIELGAGKYCRDSIIVEFYNSLSRKDKVDLKDTIDLLSRINQRVCWSLSLNHLFPHISTSSALAVASESPNHILFTTTTGNRIVSNEQWNQIFDDDGNPKRMNEFGTRSVVFISDSQVGLSIYMKFEPQLPGSELAVSLLGQQLFGTKFCSPLSELAFLNGIPVLLIQEIKGETLFSFVKRDPKKLLLINPSSISRLLVLEILINNGDANMANYIIRETPGKDGSLEYYDIFSIDNDLAFVPSFTQEIKKGKLFPNTYLSLQVQTCLFLFEQMFDYVHQDVVKVLLSKNLMVELKNWIKILTGYHEKWIEFFSNQYIIENRTKSDSSIIGVSFVPGQIKNLYSKLVRLQNLLAKRQISHFKLLESLEPMVAKRYREVFNKSPEINSVYIRYQILKQSKDEILLTSSFYLSEHVLESRDIPNAERIKAELKSGRYGPDHALYELIEVETFEQVQNNLLKTIQGINIKKKSQVAIEICDATLELALKESNLEKLTNIQEQQLFKLIEGRALLRIILRNSKELSSKHLNSFNFSNVTILNLSNSHNLESISNGIFIKSQIEMPFLKKLKINNCTKLTELMITSKNLTQLFATNCRFKIFKLDGATELDTLYLSNNSIQNIDILYQLSSFKKLFVLDLSKNQLLNNINLLPFNLVSKKIIVDNHNSNISNLNNSNGKINYNKQLSSSSSSPFYYSSSSLNNSTNLSLSSSSSSSLSSSSISSSPSLTSSIEEDIESINILSFGCYLKNANLIGRILCNKDLINNRKPIGTSGSSIKIDDRFFLYFFIDENQGKTSSEFELVRARAIVMFFDPLLDDHNDIEQIKLSVSLLKKYYKLSLNAYGLSIPYLLLGATEQQQPSNKHIPKLIQEFQKYHPNIKLIYNTGIDTKEKQLNLRKEVYDYLDHYIS